VVFDFLRRHLSTAQKPRNAFFFCKGNNNPSRAALLRLFEGYCCAFLQEGSLVLLRKTISYACYAFLQDFNNHCESRAPLVARVPCLEAHTAL